ncbi:MAG TPA: glycerophosphodiester phosphodiesterase family protein [Armatimonadota bacterium]|nr:glycerophosphodiester phosphodiesterase family protein [Armatimonadota bacterium]
MIFWLQLPLLLVLLVVLCAMLPADATQGITRGVTAHRGNSAETPENTLAAFTNALQLGVDWIETDVYRTRDGVLVLSHDADTHRTGDRTMKIAEATYAELATVDVATGFRQAHHLTLQDCPPASMPRLEDALRLIMAQQGTRLSLQPKDNCVPQILAMIKQLHAERWVGFNDGSLEKMCAVKAADPSIPVFWDRSPGIDLAKDLVTARQYGFEAIVLHESIATPPHIAAIQAAGLQAGVWTVNDPTALKRFVAMGVDRIYTDTPRVLQQIYQEHR